MNRGLASTEVIGRFPGRPVHPGQDIIEQPNGMIRWDRLIEPLGEQNQLVAWSVGVASAVE